MRKQCILTIFIFLQFFCSAQKDTLHKRGVEPGTISINAGVAASLISWTQGAGPSIAGSAVEILSVTPGYNLIADYNFTRRSSIGLCCAYQQLWLHPASGDQTIIYETDNDSRLNIALRYLDHLSKKTGNDLYVGARVGVSYWTQNKHFIPPYYNLPLSQASHYLAPSVQLLFGYRFYIIKHLAMQIEAGIGTPYFYEFGLAYRIFTQKKN